MIAETPTNLMLGGETFEHRIDPEKILNPIFDGDTNLFGFHWEESNRLCRPANRKTCATSG